MWRTVVNGVSTGFPNLDDEYVKHHSLSCFTLRVWVRMIAVTYGPGHKVISPSIDVPFLLRLYRVPSLFTQYSVAISPFTQFLRKTPTRV